MDDLRVQVRRDGPQVVMRQWRWRIIDSNDQEIAGPDLMSVCFSKEDAVRAGLRRLDQLQDPSGETAWQDVDPVAHMVEHLRQTFS